MRSARKSRTASSMRYGTWVLAAAVSATLTLPAHGETEDFNVAPADWIGLGNGGPGDPVTGPWGPYGFSNTNNTGGASPAGEAGGTFLRGNVRTYYADTTLGPTLITENHVFSATGELFVSAPEADNDILVGHFSAPPEGVAGFEFNHAGIILREFDATRFRFMARIRGNSNQQKDGVQIIVPNGNYQFKYEYNPITHSVTAQLLPIGGGAPVATSITPGLEVDIGESFEADTFGLSGGFSGVGSGQFMQAFIDGVRYTSVSQWNVNAGGDWGTAGNWNPGVPNEVGAVANFGPVTTGPVTITNSAARTVGTMHFNNGSAYTISGSGAITAQGAFVESGNHTVSAPLTFTGQAKVQIPASTTLTLSNMQNSTAAIVKTGDGTLAANRIRAASLDVTAGNVQILPSGNNNNSTSSIDALTIGANSRFDLKDNKLVTNSPIGTFTGGAYNGVQGQVARAYNFGTWDQPGLMTSMPDAGPLVGTTTVAVSNGEAVLFLAPNQTGTFGGQPVTGASTLVMYTYAGDLNLDGLVDGGDYGVIDNYFTFPGTTGYANGDFNYDGIIDGGDYGIIDNTFALQGAPFPTGGVAGLGGVAAVPEPTSILALVIPAFLAGIGRARRKVKG